MSGLLITLEGVEGCGKSTQIRLLAERMRSLELPVMVSREPGGTALGQELRRLLLEPHPSGERWTPEAELLLFYADRAHHLANLVRPALEAGQIVLLDRFEDSTRAYQGALGVPDGHMDRLAEVVLGRMRPHLTLLLDLDPALGLARVVARNASQGKDFRETRYDEAARDFHDRVRMRFLALAKKEPHRVAILPAQGTAEEVAASLWARVAPLLRSSGFRVEG